jgi:hypothetical protein
VIVNLAEKPKGCEESGSRTLERNDARIKEANLAPISQAQVPKSLRSWKLSHFRALYERHKLTTNVILLSDNKILCREVITTELLRSA